LRFLLSRYIYICGTLEFVSFLCSRITAIIVIQLVGRYIVHFCALVLQPFFSVTTDWAAVINY